MTAKREMTKNSWNNIIISVVTGVIVFLCAFCCFSTFVFPYERCEMFDYERELTLKQSAFDNYANGVAQLDPDVVSSGKIVSRYLHDNGDVSCRIVFENGSEEWLLPISYEDFNEYEIIKTDLKEIETEIAKDRMIRLAKIIIASLAVVAVFAGSLLLINRNNVSGKAGMVFSAVVLVAGVLLILYVTMRPLSR